MCCDHNKIKLAINKRKREETFKLLEIKQHTSKYLWVREEDSKKIKLEQN